MPQCTANVGVGSNTALTAHLSDFRYALESGRNSDIALCPFGAIFGLMHCCNFVGAGKQSRQLLRPDNSAIEGGSIDHLVGQHLH
jgi:hypothetical protein